MQVLALTALSLGFVHTLLGPDHYLPFVALSKSNSWSTNKTLFITAICGLAHCLSSVGLGFLGIGLGLVVGRLVGLESIRGDLASYAMIAFGLVYFIWSIKRLMKGKVHSHVHNHDGIPHQHNHSHTKNHVHKHSAVSKNAFWGMFIVFILGPCEPLIPILMYPAAKGSLATVAIVALVFTATTVLTMLAVVLFALKGLSFVRINTFERYAHTLASLTIIACGVSIVLGL